MKSIQSAGAQLVAVSYDSEEILSRFSKQKEITFSLLSDPGSDTIKAFGILNEEASGSRLSGIPYPGTFIINTDGVIEAKLFYEGYKERHEGSDILKALGVSP